MEVKGLMDPNVRAKSSNGFDRTVFLRNNRIKIKFEKLPANMLSRIPAVRKVL